MSSEKLTAATKRKISSEWASVFPTLVVWKPMWLVRRHGSMLYGLCLDGAAQPDAYVPTVFTHCLARSFPIVGLTGYAPMPDRVGQPTKIRLMSHAEKLGSMADLLAHRNPPLENGQLGLDDLLTHYRAFLRGEYGLQSPYMVDHFSALALSASLLGQQDVAQRVIDRAVKITQSWPPGVNTPSGSVSQWVEALRAQVKDPAALAAVVEAEVHKHKLSEVPDLGLGAFTGSLDSIDVLGA